MLRLYKSLNVTDAQTVAVTHKQKKKKKKIYKTKKQIKTIYKFLLLILQYLYNKFFN